MMNFKKQMIKVKQIMEKITESYKNGDTDPEAPPANESGREHLDTHVRSVLRASMSPLTRARWRLSCTAP